MRVLVVAVAVLIALLIPEFNKLFALVCSIFGPMLQVIFPLLFAWKIQRDQGTLQTSMILRGLHAGMVVVAIFTITIGFWQSLLAVLQPPTQN